MTLKSIHLAFSCTTLASTLFYNMFTHNKKTGTTRIVLEAVEVALGVVTDQYHNQSWYIISLLLLQLNKVDEHDS